MSEHSIVLCVDDTPESLNLLGSILSQKGYDTRMADSGELALEFIKYVTPDLILLDVNMPGLDGFEVCRRIKAEPLYRDIPVIFLSAEKETHTQIEGFQCGAVDFVTKPFEIEILLMRVHTHLELNRLRRQTAERVAELELVQQRLQKEIIAKNDMQIQLLQQEKMASIGQLAAGVAHEINNPMGFITSNMGTLQKYITRITEYLRTVDQVIAESAVPLKEEIASLRLRLKLDYIVDDTKQLIEESLDGANRVKNIVDDLKNLSRADQMEMVQADLNKILETALNISCNEIKYVADIVRQLADVPMILCHPQQISQVFINLLTNAGQAIERHGTITVHSWSDDVAVCVSVADSGKGMPENIIGQIFDPFFTTKDVGKGTGLGLSISYDIIKKHNGEITVESEVGKGTTFIVRFPIDGQSEKLKDT